MLQTSLNETLNCKGQISEDSSARNLWGEDLEANHRGFCGAENFQGFQIKVVPFYPTTFLYKDSLVDHLH